MHELRPIQAALEDTSDPAKKAEVIQVFLTYRQAKLFAVGKWQGIDDSSIFSAEASEAEAESVDGDPAAPGAISQHERIRFWADVMDPSDFDESGAELVFNVLMLPWSLSRQMVATLYGGKRLQWPRLRSMVAGTYR